jgi:hypothetical protein
MPRHWSKADSQIDPRDLQLLYLSSLSATLAELSVLLFPSSQRPFILSRPESHICICNQQTSCISSQNTVKDAHTMNGASTEAAFPRRIHKQMHPSIHQHRPCHQHYSKIRLSRHRISCLFTTIFLVTLSDWPLLFSSHKLSLTSFTSVNSQAVGINFCACQPTTYTFALNFTQTCADQNVSGQPGILDDDCSITGLAFQNQDEVMDKVPVAISSVRILELDRKLQVLVQTPVNYDFRDGDTFTYTSVLADRSRQWSDPDSLPHGIQMVLRGRNALDQYIDNTWIILFDNLCGLDPVLFDGDRAGWSIMVS